MMKFQRREAVFIGVIFLILICWITFKVSGVGDSASAGQVGNSHFESDFFGSAEENTTRAAVRSFRGSGSAIAFRAELPDGGTFAFVGKREEEGRLHLGLITSEVVTSADGSRVTRLLSKLVDIHEDFSGVAVLPELRQPGDEMVLEKGDMESKLRLFSQSKGVDIMTFPSVIAADGETAAVVTSITPEQMNYVDVTVVMTVDGKTRLDLGPAYSLPRE